VDEEGVGEIRGRLSILDFVTIQVFLHENKRKE
jgi:hypothetical protein